jgi:hypothetical protein
MLKHHCSTLFIPTPRTLQSTISSLSIIDETISSNNYFAFSFSVAETPLSATLHHFFFTMLKHHCSACLIFFMMLKHHCSALSTLSDAETPLFSTSDFLPDAETPLFNTFNFLPLLKHNCSALLISSDAESPLLSSTCLICL